MTASNRVRSLLIASVVVVLACVAWSATVANAAVVGDGKTAATARQIPADGTVFSSTVFTDGHVSHEEWFRFPVRAGRIYRLSQSWDYDAVVLTSVSNPDGTVMSHYWPGAEAQPSQHWVSATADGYLFVKQWSGGGSSSPPSPYSLSVLEVTASTIGGTVRLAPEGTAAAGALVSLWRADATTGDPLVTATAGATGAWSASVVPGAYVVRFDDPTGARTGEYHDGTVQVPASPGVTGIDGSLSRKGSVEGFVRSPEGVGIGGVTVTSRNPLGATTAVTAPDGSFAFAGIDSGVSHVLTVADVVGWRTLAGESLPYEVAPGAIFVAALSMHPVGTVAGTVTDVLTGAPIAGIDVARVATVSGATLGTTVTDALGRYSFGELSAGGSRMRFSDPRGVYAALSREIVVAWGEQTVADQAMSAGSVVPVPLARTSVSIHANHTAITRGRTVRLYGTVWPGQPAGTTVSVYVKRPGSNTWRYLSTRTLTGTRSWTHTTAPGIRGTYYFRAKFRGSATHAPSTSAGVKLTVR